MTERDLEERLVGICLEQGVRVAVAESCTGGLVACRITRVPGASGCFPGGAVAYENEVKTSLLGVDAGIIRELGAVSEPVARMMAEGARRVFRSDYGLGVTGIAGPSGGTAAKPVGLIYLAVSGPKSTVCREYRFTGDRQAIRSQTADAALRDLISMIMEDM